MRIMGQYVRIILLVATLLLVLLAVRLLVVRRALGNYSDPGNPFFEGSYAGEVENFDGSLRVVTWNMHHAEKLAQAIETLEDATELGDADILLFQEIDAEGVETIAQRLRYNYVFYPAFYSRRLQKEFGNAILAKWPLSYPDKIVLPNALPGWLESRNSASATILLDGREIKVYSLHLDYTWMYLSRGISQVEFLGRAAGGEDNFIILGGDFNTWTPISIAILDDQMGKIGLERLTKGTGYTFEWAGVKLTLDHIFSKDVLNYRAGVYRQTNASDHYPVWAEMSLEVIK
jgi:endonuclease/exonuclease/phosphatase family metal-dependent hydrolase